MKVESNYASPTIEIVSESDMFDVILVQCFKNSECKIAEITYVALNATGLAVKTLAFSEMGRNIYTEQDDLWTTKYDDLDGECKI